MRVHHIAIQVRDLELVSRFYSDVLGLVGLPSVRSDARWFDLNGAILMLEQCSGDPVSEAFDTPRPGLHVLALGIARNERHDYSVRLAKNQIAIERETRFSIFVRDPEGNRVALSHYPDEL